MNPVILIILLSLFVFTIVLGRIGYSGLRSLLRQNIKFLLGAVTSAIVLLLVLRGFFHPISIILVLAPWLFTPKKIIHLFKNYRNWPFSIWTAHLQSDSHTRTTRPDAGSTVMTKEQAYQILGLEPGQSREAITLAYRQAMKKTHPDHGGSSDMAVKLNLARDVLLSSHA